MTTATLWISIAILGSLGVMGALLVAVAFRVLESFNDNSRAMERLCVRVMILKGMQPHHADPKEFTPGGVSWGAYEAAKKDMPPVPESVDLEDQQNEADLRAQAEEARRIWAQTDDNQVLIDKRLADYESQARQRVGR